MLWKDRGRFFVFTGKDKDLLALVTYISADERAEKVMENQSVIRQPIVRNGSQATVGYAPDIWKNWKKDTA